MHVPTKWQNFKSEETKGRNPFKYIIWKCSGWIQFCLSLMIPDMGSIPELELMVNSGIGIDYLKKKELEVRNLEFEFS